MRWWLRLAIGRFLISMEVVSLVVEVFVAIIVIAGGCIMTARRVVMACSIFGMIIPGHAVLLAAHHRLRSRIAIARIAVMVPVLPYGLLKWRRQHILLE